MKIIVLLNITCINYYLYQTVNVDVFFKAYTIFINLYLLYVSFKSMKIIIVHISHHYKFCPIRLEEKKSVNLEIYLILNIQIVFITFLFKYNITNIDHVI